MKKRWGKLTDNDLDAIGAAARSSPATSSGATASPSDEADRQIEEWMKEPGVLDDWNDRRAILDM